jgi:type II secretory pathway component HofQ
MTCLKLKFAGGVSVLQDEVKRKLTNQIALFSLPVQRLKAYLENQEFSL